MRQSSITKPTKKDGDRTYHRWLCSWREGNKVITKYLGSCRKMNETKALRKARKLKAEALKGRSLRDRYSQSEHKDRDPGDGGGRETNRTNMPLGPSDT